MSESLLDWLPQLPEGWRTKPFFSVMRERKNLNTKLEVTRVLSLSYGRVIDRDVESNFGLLPASFDGYNTVEPNDIVMRLTDMQNDQRSLRTGMVQSQGIITSAYTTVTPDETMLPRFAHYLLHGYDLAKVYYRMGGGLRQSMKYDDLKRLPLVVPPKADQERIANFLDDKTVRIDALIAEKVQLVERLFEYRLSVATTAITQGLPGTHTEFVIHPFLGSVPLNWKTGKFRHYVQFRSGQVDPEDVQYSSMPLIAPNHIESGSGRLLGTETALEQAAESGKYWCDAGDVIYSKIRPALRKATISPFDCLCSADMYPLKGQLGLTNEFLFWYLLSEPFSVFAVQESVRVAMPKLNRETLANAVVPLPPLNEQFAIVSYIREKTASVDSVIQHATEHIARLREYRSSLISAAVTGQLPIE